MKDGQSEVPGHRSRESSQERAVTSALEASSTAWPPADGRLLDRPAHVCRALLAALAASEGRRRRRKRNTTPDSIGMSIKCELLEETVRDDPDPEAFEGWLLERCDSSAGGSGPARAMALEILADFKLAYTSESFRSWLEQGAPSEDR